MRCIQGMIGMQGPSVISGVVYSPHYENNNEWSVVDTCICHSRKPWKLRDRISSTHFESRYSSHRCS